MVLSYSKMNAFTTCPKLFYFKYIEERPDLPSPAAIIGKLVHKIIQKITIAMKDGQKYDLLEIFKQEKVPAEYMSEVDELVSIFINWTQNTEYNPEHTIGIEYQFGLDKELGFSNFDDNDNLFHGIIDRIDFNPDSKKLIITDYKTGYNNSDWLQLQLYGIALNSSNIDFDQLEIRYHYLRSNYIDNRLIEEDEFIEITDSLFDARDVILDAIETNDFPETPNHKCCWCSYKHLCETGKHFNETLEGKSVEELAKEYIVLSARTDDLRKLLKDYCSSGNRIQLNKTTVEIKQTVKTEIEDIGILTNLLASKGYSPEQYIKQVPDIRKLKGKKIMSNIPEIAGMLVEKPYFNTLAVNKEL